MDKFNISAYISISKNGFISNSGQGPAGILVLNTIGYLLNPIIDFNDKKISILVNHKKEVDAEIVRAVANPKIYADIISKFQTDVSKDINLITIGNVCMKLIKLVNSEPNLSIQNKKLLNLSYDNDDKATFLAKVLIHAVGMSNTNDVKTPTNDEVEFLTETNNHCPLCSTKLIKDSRGRKVYDYNITMIYDDSFDEEIKKELETVYPAPSSIDIYENKIALCIKCMSSYKLDPLLETYKSLYDKKRSIIRNLTITSLLTSLDIEKSLATIITDLGNLNKDKESGLVPMIPSELKNKIPDDIILKDDVTKWVLRYYNFIEQQFSNLEASGSTRFKIIANQISSTFETLDNLGYMRQNEIFSTLSQWIITDLGYTNDKLSIVNIIVAFFVQNCEVFREIS